MIATENLQYTAFTRKTYPPSLLIIGENTAQNRQFKRRLEDNGCQVCLTDISSESRVANFKKYFDLIVLDLQHRWADCIEICKKLEDNAELLNIPMVILTTPQYADTSLNRSKIRPFYSLTVDDSVEMRLLRILEQIRYMTDRYL